MPAATQRRRTRYDTPAWAERFPSTPEGFDQMHAHGEARRLPRHTDPDAIDDPDVRDAFLSQLNEEHEHDEHGGGPAADERGKAHHVSEGSSSRSWSPGRFSVPASLGSAMTGLIVYAIGVNFVRGGPAQVRQWFSAKLTNGGGQLP